MQTHHPPVDQRYGRAVKLAAGTPAVLFLVAAWACSRAAPITPPPPKVDVVQPTAREVTEWDEYTARFEAVESVEVRPRVSGYLQAIHFRDGAMVTKGAQLFTIDPRPYEAALRHAEADLALARARQVLAQKNLARSGDLLHSHAISQEEADIRESSLRQAEASIQEAQAAVDAAKLDVEFTQITAPVAGRISRRLVTEGNLINGGVGTSGTLLATIVSLDPIYAYFEADERALLKYERLARAGQRPSSRDFRNPVWIGLADEEGFPHQGSMDFVDNQVDRGTGTIVGRALVANPELLFTPGLFARLRLRGSGEYDALLLPDEAIGTDQSRKFVFIVNDQAQVETRAVKLGPLVDGLRVVHEGIAPDDWVIVAGMQRVRPGLKVDAQRRSITPAPTVTPGEAPTATSPGPG